MFQRLINDLVRALTEALSHVSSIMSVSLLDKLIRSFKYLDCGYILMDDKQTEESRSGVFNLF